MHKFSQLFEDGMFVRCKGNQDSQETLLFIHGLGESGLCFEKLVQRTELSPYHILLPDLPGYGRSLWPAESDANLQDLANYLAAWVVKNHKTPVTLIGHSMGGVVALLLAEQHPQIVSRVIDVDGNISPDDCVFSSQALTMGRQQFTDGGFDELRESIFTKGIDDAAQKGYYVSLRLADAGTYYRHSEELVRLSSALDLAHRLEKLKVPVFYIAGFPNGVSTPSRRLLQEAHIKVRDIAPSGHWPFIDQEDQFISTLQECLSSD